MGSPRDEHIAYVPLVSRNGQIGFVGDTIHADLQQTRERAADLQQRDSEAHYSVGVITPLSGADGLPAPPHPSGGQYFPDRA